jgi:hypothetical protein
MLHFCRLVLLASAALLLLTGCPTGDDDDSARTIPPPEGCDNPSLSNVSFQFLIHFAEVDYPQNELVSLMTDVWQTDLFSFPFTPAIITELGPDPDTGRMAVTFTDNTPPPKGGEPPEDPNFVRIVYELPLGYELPVALGDSVASVVVLDLTQGDLIAAFGLWKELEDGFELLFLAEPADAGMAWAPGPYHPVFAQVATRDRACPNLNVIGECASTYNLALQFEVHPEPVEEGDVEVPGPSLELWPTEHADFTLVGLDLRVVNVWSFTHREINPDCTNPYDFSAERFSWFVTRTSASPAD